MEQPLSFQVVLDFKNGYDCVVVSIVVNCLMMKVARVSIEVKAF